MTAFEARLLGSLRAKPGRTMTDLAAELGCGRVDISRGLLWLERGRLAVRTRYRRGCDTWHPAPPAAAHGGAGAVPQPVAQLEPAARSAKPSGRDRERTRPDQCRNCGASFTSVRANNGRWSRTCSPPCRLAALDRLIQGLLATRAKLVEQIEADAGRRPGRR